jgi:putative restriction endonuclease
MAIRLWSREELILAFNLYLKLPFGKMHSRTPEIVMISPAEELSKKNVSKRN